MSAADLKELQQAFRLDEIPNDAIAAAAPAIAIACVGILGSILLQCCFLSKMHDESLKKKQKIVLDKPKLWVISVVSAILVLVAFGIGALSTSRINSNVEALKTALLRDAATFATILQYLSEALSYVQSSTSSNAAAIDASTVRENIDTGFSHYSQIETAREAILFTSLALALITVCALMYFLIKDRLFGKRFECSLCFSYFLACLNLAFILVLVSLISSRCEILEQEVIPNVEEAISSGKGSFQACSLLEQSSQALKLSNLEALNSEEKCLYANDTADADYFANCIVPKKFDSEGVMVLAESGNICTDFVDLIKYYEDQICVSVLDSFKSAQVAIIILLVGAFLMILSPLFRKLDQSSKKVNPAKPGLKKVVVVAPNAKDRVRAAAPAPGKKKPQPNSKPAVKAHSAAKPKPRAK